MAKNKKLISVLKIGISIVLLYFIFSKIDVKSIGEVVSKANITPLLIAFILFVFSKIMASFRLNTYFHAIGLKITQTSNLKLYLLGMFYNLFLPGGIGGDAYKGYIIHKKFDVKTKRIVSVLLLDRLSGLLLLFIYCCIIALGLKHSLLQSYQWLFIVAIVASIAIFWALAKKFFAFVQSCFWKSFGFSALVQLGQLISIYCLLVSLGINTDELAYLFLFLISSIVSVIPLTIGGIGSRELTFYYGASQLALNEAQAVSISVIFFLITAIVSLSGVYFHFRKPELIVEN